MRNLKQIKDDYAKSHAFNDWENMYSSLSVLQKQDAMDEVAKLYATEYGKEVQKNCAEKVKLKEFKFWDDGEFCVKSILSEDNLPSHE